MMPMPWSGSSVRTFRNLPSVPHKSCWRAVLDYPLIDPGIPQTIFSYNSIPEIEARLKDPIWITLVSLNTALAAAWTGFIMNS